MGGNNQSKILISVGVGLTTGACLYYLLGDSKPRYLGEEESSNNVKPILGLKNLGYTCFINSVLQALAASRHFNDWIFFQDNLNQTSPFGLLPGNYSRFEYPVIAMMSRTMLAIGGVIKERDYWQSEKVPCDVIKTLRKAGYVVHANEEQDTLEFFQLILEALNKEVLKSVRRRQTGTVACILDQDDVSEISGEIISEQEINDVPTEPFVMVPNPTPGPSDEFNSSGGWSTFDDISGPVIVNRVFSRRNTEVDTSMRGSSQTPFRFTAWITLQCLSCLTKLPSKIEVFDSLTLPLPVNTSGKLTNVDSLLADLSKPQLVCNVDCPGCSRQLQLPTKSVFTKKMVFAKLPATLCLHLQRTLWKDGTCGKLSQFITFPERLDMSKVSRLIDEHRHLTNDGGGDNVKNVDPSIGFQKLKNTQYELSAVVSHFGDPESGHYVTFKRGHIPCNYNPEQWFCVSDQNITPVTLDAVLSTPAYLLFYDKFDVQTSTSSVGSGYRQQIY